jgi:hypothetical protein
MSRNGARARAMSGGFTIVEAVFVVLILAVVFGALTAFVRTGGATYRAGSRAMRLEERGSRTLHRIVDALRTADSLSVSAVPAPPFSTDRIVFQRNLGYGAHETSWSAPLSLELDAGRGRVLRRESPGLPGEQTTVWCLDVPALLEGETPNGLDDNGNGLIDEGGLCFSREGDLLSIRLTVRDATDPRDVRTRTWTTSLLIRN